MKPQKLPVFNELPVRKLPKKGSVELNQPYPEELNHEPIVEIASHIGQKVLDKSVQKDPAQIKNPDNVSQPLSTTAKSNTEATKNKKGMSNTPVDKPDTSSKSKGENKKSSQFGNKAAAKDKQSSASNQVVKIIVILGLTLMILGIILFIIVSFSLGIILMALGGIAVIACVFLPSVVRKKLITKNSN